MHNLDRHFDGEAYYSHREVHNLYGFLEVSATYSGLKARSPFRPFVLTRSFFAGSQRYAAVWTGDAHGTWSHLRLNLSMLQSLSISGFSFCGGDIPGFSGNPSQELVVRWYQAGVFFPFMRAHACKGTERREPWVFPEEIRNYIGKAIRMRYELLAYLYTSFYYLVHVRNWPLVMPLWVAFKQKRVEGISEIEDEFMLGEAVLVKPICKSKAKAKT